jgi:hypothetical protein
MYQQTYGFFYGGDPRSFSPDHESCTEQEIANHKKAVELAEKNPQYRCLYTKRNSSSHNCPLHSTGEHYYIKVSNLDTGNPEEDYKETDIKLSFGIGITSPEEPEPTFYEPMTEVIDDSQRRLLLKLELDEMKDIGKEIGEMLEKGFECWRSESGAGETEEEQQSESEAKTNEKFEFEHDSQALIVLCDAGIKQVKGVIQLKFGTVYPPKIIAACNYLCDEWDYGLCWFSEFDNPDKTGKPEDGGSK